MGKVTWRGVTRHPVRFALSVLAVILGIAFVSGTFSLRTMMSATFDSIVDQSMTADVYLQGKGDKDAQQNVMDGSGVPQIPLDTVQEAEAVKGVDKARAGLQGSMVLVGADGTAVQSSQAPSFAIAVYPDDTDLTVTSGRLPEKSGEIALEEAAYEKSGLKVGDTTTVILNGEMTQQTVVGVLHFDAPMAGAILVAVDQGTAEKLFAPEGTVQSIAVTAAKGTSAEQVVKNLQAKLPATIDVLLGSELRAESKEAISSQLGFISTFLMVFAAIALFVGGFIIANTFAMLIRQRMRELAVLRAIGASPAQVFGSVVGQAAIVGAVGAALGVLAGLGLVEILRAVFSSMGMELDGSTPLNGTTVALCLGLGVLVAVVSAAVPAMNASRVPPVEAMNEQVSTKERTLRWRGLIGGILVAGGIGAAVSAVLNPDGTGAVLGAGAAALLVGMLVLSPVLAPWIITVLAWPFAKVIRPLGALARGNVVRNPRRTANTSGALMIGMALVGAATVLASSTQASLAGMVEKDLKADYVLQGSGMSGLPAGALTAVEGVADAKRVDTFMYTQLDVNGETTYVTSATPGAFVYSVDPRVDQGTLESFDQGEAFVSKSAAESNKWKVGDTLTLTQTTIPGIPDKTVIIGAIISSQAFSDPVIVPRNVFDDVVPQSLRVAGTAFVTGADGATQSLHDQLAAAVKPYFVVSVQDRDEFTSALADQVNQMLYVLYALLGLSIVIAVLGIVNTLTLSIMERTREIGLMRAVGLGRLQLSTTVVIESVLIAVFGAVAGLAVGIGLASALPSVFKEQGMSTLSVPWGSVVVMLVLAAIVGVVAALWPAIRAQRLPILEAISYE